MQMIVCVRVPRPRGQTPTGEHELPQHELTVIHSNRGPLTSSVELSPTVHSLMINDNPTLDNVWVC